MRTVFFHPGTYGHGERRVATFVEKRGAADFLARVEILSFSALPAGSAELPAHGQVTLSARPAISMALRPPSGG
jgi:hypothetical protein